MENTELHSANVFYLLCRPTDVGQVNTKGYIIQF